VILNQSADYALRAVLMMAGANARLNAEVIARALGVPRNYLGKILNQLVNAEVLTSVRGPRGGFTLARPAAETSLEDVVAPFQKLPARSVCLLGDRPCNTELPCVAHQRWRSMSDPVIQFFRATTVQQMLQDIPA
jgi:Rrf2 family protein